LFRRPDIVAPESKSSSATRTRRGNENTNRLLRQYFPKGTDMSKLTQQDLDQAAHSLHTRPRQTLDWMTTSDKLAEGLQ